MEYTLQNELLQIKVTDVGAELVSVKNNKGEEMLWQADANVWARQAPLLFPYSGGLFDNVLLAKGKELPAARHGFARDGVFTCEEHTADTLVLELVSNDETLALFPYAFVLRVIYTLKGANLRQVVTVENPSADEVLPCSVGFHPGFKVPFDDKHTTEDYSFVFEQTESPSVIETPGGLVSGVKHVLFTEGKELPLTDDLFAEDSICMEELQSSYICLQEKPSEEYPQGRSIRVEIDSFPYLLLWGPAKGPLPFVCIEPWNSLPDGPERYAAFADKPGIQKIEPGKSWQTELDITFNR